MDVIYDRRLTLTVAFASLWLAACDIDVQDHDKEKNVDVRTLVGDISVRSGKGGVETGLPVYPGSTPLHDDDEPENADVRIRTPFFGMHIAAAKFESSDAPQGIADFYRDKLSAFGTVVECKGDIDFEDDTKQPTCDDEPALTEIQLVAGTEENHRIVAVKPRGDGAEFAVVSIQIEERE